MIAINTYLYKNLEITLSSCDPGWPNVEEISHLHFDLQDRTWDLEFSGTVMLAADCRGLLEILDKIYSLYLDGSMKIAQQGVVSGSITVQ